MTIPEHASCETCGREDRPLVGYVDEDDWYAGAVYYLCDRHSQQWEEVHPSMKKERA